MLFSSILLFISESLYGQSSNPLQEIRIQYEDGKINLNEAISNQLETLSSAEGTHAHIKCATPLFSLLNKYSENPTTGSPINNFLDTPSFLAAESYISDSGKFIIFYETTGQDAVPLADENSNSIPDYVEWVAEASDFSYDYEVNTLGFADFIPNGSQYRVTIANGGAYGFTFRNSNAPGGTEIGIENDFDGFPANDDPEGDQKGAIKVTMAHEIKHAIQFAQNGWNGDSDRWAEMDATLMEEVVYDEVNDYYNYLDGFGNNFFRAPTRTLIPGSYDDIAWALYFHERFGADFWKEVWAFLEEDTTVTFLEAVELAIQSYELSFEEAITEAMLWHFASGEFSNVLYGFDESSFYPTPRITESFDSLQTEFADSVSLSRFSGRYYNFDLLETEQNLVQINFLPSNSTLQVGLIAYYNNGSVETRFINNTDSNVVNASQTTLSWRQIDHLGVVLFNSSTTKTVGVKFQVLDYIPTEVISAQLAQNYPNPFNPSTTIEIELPFSQQVRLAVYDYLGREIQVLRDGVVGAGKTPILFNAARLASGIYFYQLESNEGILTKKMTLIK